MKNKPIFTLAILAIILISAAVLAFENLRQEKAVEKDLGVIPSSQKLQNRFCKDNDSGVEISYQEAIEIAQKDKCGLQGEELVAFSENYLCNENTGTWWVDLVIKPEKEGCNPACVVDIVDKTAEVNWRCTGVIRYR